MCSSIFAKAAWNVSITRRSNFVLVFSSLWRMRAWQVTFVRRHIASGRVCGIWKTPLRDVGLHQFCLCCSFQCQLVAKIVCWICLQCGFLFCRCSVLVWFLSILFSPLRRSVVLCAGWQDVASFAAFRFEKLRPARCQAM